MRIAILLLALVLAAGCGGGDEESAPSEQTREDATLDFARCMREHGIDLPDPRPGRPPQIEVDAEIPQDKLEAAGKACGHLLDDAFGPVSQEQKEAFRDSALAYTRCMRRHGIDLPDPDADGFVQIDPQAMGEGQGGSPRFRKANAACEEKLFPAGG